MQRHAPATDRNRDPILEVLRRTLPASGRLLEIASGTGQHAAFFSQALPDWSYLPSDTNHESLPSIAAWTEDLANVAAPALLNVEAVPEKWPVGAPLDAILCINMIHISPWQATQGLMRGAGRHLAPGGVLYTYGPYRIDGQQTSPSNERFEEWLLGLDPRFGVRDVADVTAEAARNGLQLVEQVPMPANNFSLIFRRD